MNEKILIVDDEVTICELLKIELELEGYVCEMAHDGKNALEKFSAFSPDLVLLDLMLPGVSGYEVCESLRAVSNVPIIMLTAKAEIDDKVLGLGTGADDYVTKPFDTYELLARVKALIRRYKSLNDRKKRAYRNGALKLIPESQSAYINEKQIKLTLTEFDILLLLIQNKNMVFSRDAIASGVGIKNFQDDTRALDMHIQRLRRKLAAATDVKYIETVFGSGYKMRDFDENEI
jgi:DNA-binding response OmpR family regulator